MIGYIRDVGLAVHATTNGMSFRKDNAKASLRTGVSVPL
jgi:hypothetical protein